MTLEAHAEIIWDVRNNDLAILGWSGDNLNLSGCRVVSYGKHNAEEIDSRSYLQSPTAIPP
jgi:hypothetical protein